MEKASIMIVEDQRSIYDRFAAYLIQSGHELTRMPTNGNVVGRLRQSGCDLILTTVGRGTGPHDDLRGLLEMIEHAVPVIAVAESGSVRQAVDAVHAGATDCLCVSDDNDLLEKSIENILKNKLNTDNKTSKKASRPSLVCTSPVMHQLLEMAKRVAPSAATVLIQGESGTGKEVLTRYIHDHSGRRDQPLVAMNCAALPDNLAESELFGYERGAFTGAVQRRQGKFELAHRGTLLLDEISEMAFALQAKLLRVLQESEVDRIGGKHPISVDVRVIATTNRDLGQMVKQGQFRQDLYYRLRILPLHLPSLRERPEDISVLAAHFISKHCPDDDQPIPCFDAQAIAALQQWHWPGNVRELENCVQRALLLRNGPCMGRALLMLEDHGHETRQGVETDWVGMTVREMEARLIGQTLQHVNENRTHAAEMLGISIRTLRNKLREYREQGEAGYTAAGNG
ncbi:MAG: sigma-54-dependent Fis family transcriptional regulator [Desulfatitalea sp.]|nr:sigma-54 dependent transcriptional regulator [Desulfatitalea sp.]NNJ99868.1 sigma-54-dependent Fis family transcriptional regulator [Desulfatitalea sp.]